MHLSSCQHPKIIFNKYLGEKIAVPCGECPICKRRRANKWVSRLERERINSAFTFFVTLTYDDQHLPLAVRHGVYDGYYQNTPFDEYVHDWFASGRDDVSFSMEDLDVDDWQKEDHDLFGSLCQHFGGIPYASVRDIQLFNKRLNKRLHNETNSFKNFRYFVVSEFGDTTFRPHFHGIYFLQDERAAKVFQECLSSSWQYGRLDCQFVQNSACTYVAQYLNKLVSLPYFYQKKPLRPFFLFSKSPTIGADAESSESLYEVFDNCLTERCVQQTANSTNFVNVPIDKGLENRLFGKPSFFDKIPHSLRIELFGFSERYGQCASFKEFLINVAFDVFIYGQDGYKKCTCFLDFLAKVCDNFTEKGINLIRRYYYFSRSKLHLCKLFGISVVDYLNKMYEYWDKKELKILHDFYEFQRSYPERLTDELALMYPVYYCDNFDEQDYYNALSKTNDFVQLLSDNEFKNLSETKSHFKNMYLESLRLKDNFMYNQFKKYHYAKKCNEVNQALAT